MAGKKPKIAMPEDVRQALEAGELLGIFEARPDNQQNGYLAWIIESRRDITRRKRLRQMLEELYSGDTYMGASWGGACKRPNKH